jgi:NADPH:quinone reductase-like Zn-dependent oxidoreductase
VLGMYPGDPGPPGGDCAGVVMAVGAGVTHLKAGDAVFGLASGSLGSHVHTNALTGEEQSSSQLFRVQQRALTGSSSLLQSCPCP